MRECVIRSESIHHKYPKKMNVRFIQEIMPSRI